MTRPRLETLIVNRWNVGRVFLIVCMPKSDGCFWQLSHRRAYKKSTLVYMSAAMRCFLHEAVKMVVEQLARCIVFQGCITSWLHLRSWLCMQWCNWDMRCCFCINGRTLLITCDVIKTNSVRLCTFWWLWGDVCFGYNYFLVLFVPLCRMVWMFSTHAMSCKSECNRRTFSVFTWAKGACWRKCV